MLRRLSAPLFLAAMLPVAAAAQTPTDTAARTLSLADAIHLAEQGNEAVGIARAGVRSAAGQQRRARADFLPQLTGTASYTRTLRSQFSALASGDSSTGPVTDTTAAPSSCAKFIPDPALPVDQRVGALEQAVACQSSVNPFASFRDLPFGQKNQYNLGLQLSQNLFAGGRILAAVRSASAGRRQAEIELTAQQAQLVLDVTQAYYDAALNDQLVTIAEAGLEQTERTLGDVRLAREVGNLPEFDLLRAQVARDNQRPVVIQRRAARDIAYLRLKQLLALPLEQPLALTTPLADSAAAEAPLALPASLVRAEADDTTPEERAAVRQAAAGVEAAEGQYAIARAQGIPSLVLTSNFARIAYPASGLPSWDNFVSDWNVGLTLRWSFFTGGRIAGDREIARAGVEQARLRLSQTRKFAALDARSARAQYDAALAAWSASAGTVDQAGRAYDIAQVRYKEGISTQTELSQSRLELEQARANRAQAARDLQVARVRQALLRDLPLSAPASATGSTGAQAGQPFTGGGAPSAPPSGGQPPVTAGGTVSAASAGAPR